MMRHADLLARLLPPASFDARGAAIAAELAAEGDALDVALGDSDHLLDEADPLATAALAADWERVYGLPDPALPVATRALAPGVYALTAADLASFGRAGSASYLTAAGVVATAGADVPRISANGLLIEAAATNLALYSEQLDTWSNVRASVIPNAATAPDGNVTADKLVEDSSVTTTHEAYSYVNKAAAPITYTYSVFAKAAERTQLLLLLDSSIAGSARCLFDLAAGTAGIPSLVGGFSGAAAGIVALANGWYRCWVSAVSDSDTKVYFEQFLCVGGSYAYTGDGASGLYLWGGQLEAAPAPSSYIPTTASTATRAADFASVPVPQSLPERRAALLAKIRLLGGQSAAFFVALAAALGYAITITECHPQTSEDDSEYEARDDQYRFIWIVNAALYALRELCSEDDSETATAVWGNALLETFITRYKPAHTIVLFAYS